MCLCTCTCLCSCKCVCMYVCTCAFVLLRTRISSICNQSANTHNPTAATPNKKISFSNTRVATGTQLSASEGVRRKGAATPHSTLCTSLTPRHFGEEAGRFVADVGVCGRPLWAAHFTCGFFFVQHLEDGGLAKVRGDGGEEDRDGVRSEGREERGILVKRIRNLFRIKWITLEKWYDGVTRI